MNIYGLLNDSNIPGVLANVNYIVYSIVYVNAYYDTLGANSMMV